MTMTTAVPSSMDDEPREERMSTRSPRRLPRRQPTAWSVLFGLSLLLHASTTSSFFAPPAAFLAPPLRPPASSWSSSAALSSSSSSVSSVSFPSPTSCPNPLLRASPSSFKAPVGRRKQRIFQASSTEAMPSTAEAGGGPPSAPAHSWPPGPGSGKGPSLEPCLISKEEKHVHMALSYCL